MLYRSPKLNSGEGDLPTGARWSGEEACGKDVAEDELILTFNPMRVSTQVSAEKQVQERKLLRSQRCRSLVVKRSKATNDIPPGVSEDNGVKHG